MLCGEALEASSGGAYAACLHRVRGATQPRVSTVFELRITRVPTAFPLPWPSSASSPCHASGHAARESTAPPMALGAAAAMGSRRGEAAEPEPEAEAGEEEDEDQHAQHADAGAAYCLEFVRARLVSILGLPTASRRRASTPRP